MEHALSLGALYEQLGTAAAAENLAWPSGTPFVVVELDPRGRGPRDTPPRVPSCPVVALATTGTPVPDIVDVVVNDVRALDDVIAAIRRHPAAASVLVHVLRHSARASTEDGLLTESLAYSTLQHGAEFRAWLATRQARKVAAPARPVVTTRRDADTLVVTLTHPERRNAYSAAMRDALCEALHVADADASIREVLLRGDGPAFCSGGDLDEFGSASDAAVAHVSRATRSAAALLARLAPQCVAELHGACIGAGIELPAYAHHVRARRDAFFQLPEHAMGLIPGAGGTVSITRRIGRQRTAWLALSNTRLDAATAHAWGLVDELY
jgi:enoyl-CoA hydratase